MIALLGLLCGALGLLTLGASLALTVVQLRAAERSVRKGRVRPPPRPTPTTRTPTTRTRKASRAPAAAPTTTPPPRARGVLHADTLPLTPTSERPGV